MAEVLARFTDHVVGDDRRVYRAQASGAPMPDGLWEGWIEFIPIAGGEPVRTGRETTQPNHADAVYWATGLTSVYMEGALRRALTPTVRTIPEPAQPMFDGPAPDITIKTAAPTGDAILDPFSVYEKGETLLRRELGALSPWHLVNIIQAYRLSPEPVEILNRLPGGALVDLIVTAVREHSAVR
jgi:hypothetical protein